MLVKGNLDSWMPREERQRNCRNAPLRALLAPQAGDCVIVRVDLSRQGRQRGYILVERCLGLAAVRICANQNPTDSGHEQDSASSRCALGISEAPNLECF